MNSRAKRIVGSIMAVTIVATPFGYVGWLEYRSYRLLPGPKVSEFVCLDEARMNCVWIKYRVSVVPEPHPPLTLPAHMDPNTFYGRVYNWLFEVPAAAR
jgi:hypothetical protein